MASNNARERLPHLTVAALVTRGDRFLVVKEWQDGELVLNQPAGHVENGERLQQAVMRGTLEESGWQVEPKAIVGLYAFTPFVGADTYHRVLIHCEAIGEVTTHLDSDIDSAHWLTMDEICASKLRSPLVQAGFDDYLKGQGFPLEMIDNSHISPVTA